MTMTRTELQTQFHAEKGIECVNSQGEPDIDYVQWLEDKVLEQSRQAAVSGSLPFVRVLMVDGSFVKGKLLSLNGAKKQGIELKIDEKCLVEIEKKEPNCYQVNIVEIDKKYISDWRQ